MSALIEQEIELNVKKIIALISKKTVEEIQIHDSLVEDLGVDSIQFLELLAMLEEEFRFELGVEDIRPELFRTVRSVIYFVKERVMQE